MTTHVLALAFLSASIADMLSWGHDPLWLGLAVLAVLRIVVLESYSKPTRRAYHRGKVDKCWLIG